MPRPKARTPYSDARWPSLRKRILARDGHICRIRGPRCTGKATSVDHITPVVLGGSWFDPANLRAACQRCNSSRFTPVAVDTRPASTPSREW